jgi:hypothetical protein
MNRVLIDCELMPQREGFQVQQGRDRSITEMQANSAETTGDIIQEPIAMGSGKSGSAPIQGDDVQAKSQACSCLRGFGMDNSFQASWHPGGA